MGRLRADQTALGMGCKKPWIGMTATTWHACRPPPSQIETFLPGREFTVGVLGRSYAKLYSRNPEWYEKDGFHRFPILELDMTRSVTPKVYSQASKSKDVGEEGAPDYVCPARPQSDPDSDLLGALTHTIGHNAVDADE